MIPVSGMILINADILLFCDNILSKLGGAVQEHFGNPQVSEETVLVLILLVAGQKRYATLLFGICAFARSRSGELSALEFLGNLALEWSLGGAGVH